MLYFHNTRVLNFYEIVKRGLDKQSIALQINNFLVSPQKYVLWLLIRIASLMSTHNIYFL